MAAEKRLLIIGIDEYQGGMYRSLSNAKRDVERFSKVLEEKYGFIPAQKPLYDSDATNQNITEALIDLSISCHKDDSVIIYFAGHGLQHPTSKKGCWIPYDGEDGQRTFIFNSTVLDYIEAIPARHIMLISDSCFSGTFITRRRGLGIILTPEELEKRNSRWLFVSGEETAVSDGIAGEGSPFGIALCQFLEENTSPVLTAAQLFDAVIRMVANKHDQQPQAEYLPCPSHDDGQMVFRLNNIGGEDDRVPFPVIPFPLPEPKVEYYIPRQLTYHEHQQVAKIWFFQPDVEKIYLNELVASQKRLVILGAAGSGKSIELLSLAHRFQAENNVLNPIYKRFNTYTNENIGDYLPEDWKNSDPGNLLVMLDGLDEIQPQYFQTAIRKIIAFSDENPLVRIVISCRNNFYEAPYDNFSGTLEGFLVYNLNNISLPEIKAYAIDKFNIDGQGFIEQVYENGFLDLVQKPFFLNILIKHYIDHGNLASGRSQIMEEALFTYYNNDKEHFKTTIPILTRNQSLKYLEKIAFVLELLGKNFLTDDELEELFPDTVELNHVKYLPAFSKSAEQDKWLFEHNNIQEYIASRVLSRKSLDEIIKVIAVQAGGKDRIKPSWVNTLSFFISISGDEIVHGLINWIVENDIEVIVKFEPDRINAGRRLLLFRQIIEFYNSKEIWIYSNNFSDKELARFCETEAALKYLLEIIESEDIVKIAKLNCLNVLRYFNLKFFGNYIKRIKIAVIKLLDNSEITGSDTYSVMGTIADLKIANKHLIDYLIEKYGQRRNQYVRAGLYKILVKAELVDEYVDIFIDGIDLVDLTSPISDREKVNLMSESDYLKLGFEMVSKPKSIKQVLGKLSSSENRREVFLSEYQDIMESLILSSILAFKAEPSIYNNILNLLLNESLHHRSKILNALIEFFKQTDTAWTAVEEIWSSEKLDDYSKGTAIVLLVDNKVVDAFLKVYGHKKEFVLKFYNLLVWHQYSVDSVSETLKTMEKSAVQYDIALEQPKMKDWTMILEKRNQQSFDLWFDDQAMIKVIKRIYTEIGGKLLGRNDLFDYKRSTQITIEDRFPNSATAILNKLTQQDKKIDFETAKSWIVQNLSYSDFRINHIYSELTSKKTLQISEKQIDLIRNWSITKGNDKRILWDFINRFEIILPENVLLDFTERVSFNYDFKMSNPGSIDELENFISVEKIKERVAENLNNPELGPLEWTNNAAYALRKSMSETYAVILNRLSKDQNDEYKFRDLLDFWFTKVKNIESIKKLILEVTSDGLKWRAINLLEKEGKETEFLCVVLKEIIESPEETGENKKYAANHLMKLNDIYGLEYISQIIIEDPDPKFDFRISLGNISMISDINALNILMRLLIIGKRPEFKNDDFNDLEERCLAGIYSIGVRSSENFIVVKKVLEEFIEKNKNVLPNLNFLYYTILKIEENLKLKYSPTSTIKSAIEEYNQL
ncbi:caspase family protein [Pedobacter sp. Hv1]|uniref:caspase family protein n=1 Tax=Pedobacter sp. Hv1 TaxID=1740090 RepID=UPI0006D888C8|nr:caspase family protein [Pedobacter sp. Hv1]KQC00387.1 hypothetical protein AQF98_12950 [Pedobacter sp. Hv1]